MERGNDLDLNYPGYWFEKGAQLTNTNAFRVMRCSGSKAPGRLRKKEVSKSILFKS
jgi:hypothetical protein